MMFELRRPRSTTWFDRGADALARLLPGIPRGYVCPLCLRLFRPEQIDELNIDHVPARAVGGRRLVLSCIGCNLRASLMQREMKRREDMLESIQIQSRQLIRLELSTGAIVRAEIVDDGNVIQLRVLEGNSKEALEQFSADMSSVTADGGTDWSLKVKFERYAYHGVAAHVGWLREAYLVAFATFGYRFALDPALNVVRRQLDEPKSRTIPVFKLEDPRHGPETRRVVVVREPDWAQAVVVQIGRRTIFLPQPGDFELYDRLAEHATGVGAEAVGIAFRGGLIPHWPTEPMHLLDD